MTTTNHHAPLQADTCCAPLKDTRAFPQARWCTRCNVEWRDRPECWNCGTANNAINGIAPRTPREQTIYTGPNARETVDTYGETE